MLAIGGKAFSLGDRFDFLRCLVGSCWVKLASTELGVVRGVGKMILSRSVRNVARQGYMRLTSDGFHSLLLDRCLIPRQTLWDFRRPLQESHPN